MKKLILSAIAAAALASTALPLPTFAAAGDANPPGVERMMANQSLMLDAKLAGMKTVLKLTPDQEKLWPAFETAVRDGEKMRMEMMSGMREMMKSGEAVSPIDMMTKMSDHLSKASQALKQVADAAKPLYDSLNAEQKTEFGPLLRMLHGGMMGGGMMHGGMMGGGMMGHKM